MVDFAFSELQEMLQASARVFLTANASKEIVREIEGDPSVVRKGVWTQMAALDWLGLALPEAANGAGGDLVDAAIIAAEIGRAALPCPFIPTTTVALCLADVDRGGEVVDLLDGSSVAVWAIAEGNGWQRATPPATTALRHRSQYEITGQKLFCPYGQIADTLIVSAALPSGEVGLFHIPAGTDGLIVRGMSVIGGDPLANIRLDSVRVGDEALIAEGRAAVRAAKLGWLRSVALKSSELVGGAEQVVSMTAEHAKARVQFGRPIGSFQAVQHLLADAATLTRGALLATYEANWRLSQGMPADRQTSVAKIVAAEAYRRAVSVGSQIQAGMGYMQESDLQFYFRASASAKSSYGTVEEHLDIVAAAAVAESASTTSGVR